MRELSLDEIKAIELGLLKEFDHICEANNLRYSLGGGTLLGAIRHMGFIPWDDDIDVMMPREDYDKFIQITSDMHNDSFQMISYEVNHKYQNLYAKAYHPKTTMVDEAIELKDYDMGVFIDIFPLDGLGQNFDEAKRNFNRTTFKRELLNARTWMKYSRSKTHSWYVEPVRLALFVLSRFCDSYRLLVAIDKVNREVMFNDSKVAGCVCGSYRLKEIMDTEVFSNYISIPFEDSTFQSIKDYDAYLTKHYGDYMQLPPEDKRQTHHTYKAYYLD